MQVFRIEVAHRETSAPDVLYIEAATSEEAAQKANDQGWLVSAVGEAPPIATPPRDTSVPSRLRAELGRTHSTGENVVKRADNRTKLGLVFACMGVTLAVVAGYQWGKAAGHLGSTAEVQALVDQTTGRSRPAMTKAEQWQLVAEQDKRRNLLMNYAQLLRTGGPLAVTIGHYDVDGSELKKQLPISSQTYAEIARAREEAAKWLDEEEIERLLPASLIPKP